MITTQFLIFLFYVLCMGVLPACMSVHHSYGWCPQKLRAGQKRASNPMELELQMVVVELPKGCWELDQVLWKSSQCAIISPSLLSSSLQDNLLTFALDYSSYHYTVFIKVFQYHIWSADSQLIFCILKMELSISQQSERNIHTY